MQILKSDFNILKHTNRLLKFIIVKLQFSRIKLSIICISTFSSSSSCNNFRIFNILSTIQILMFQSQHNL